MNKLLEKVKKGKELIRNYYLNLSKKQRKILMVSIASILSVVLLSCLYLNVTKAARIIAMVNKHSSKQLEKGKADIELANVESQRTVLNSRKINSIMEEISKGAGFEGKTINVLNEYTYSLNEDSYWTNSSFVCQIQAKVSASIKGSDVFLKEQDGDVYICINPEKLEINVKDPIFIDKDEKKAFFAKKIKDEEKTAFKNGVISELSKEYKDNEDFINKSVESIMELIGGMFSGVDCNVKFIDKDWNIIKQFSKKEIKINE